MKRTGQQRKRMDIRLSNRNIYIIVKNQIYYSSNEMDISNITFPSIYLNDIIIIQRRIHLISIVNTGLQSK